MVYLHGISNTEFHNNILRKDVVDLSWMYVSNLYVQVFRLNRLDTLEKLSD